MEPENHEGWRVSIDEGDGKKGWCLLRPSIHDPLCVLNIESEVQGGIVVLLLDTFSDLELRQNVTGLISSSNDILMAQFMVKSIC